MPTSLRAVRGLVVQGWRAALVAAVVASIGACSTARDQPHDDNSQAESTKSIEALLDQRIAELDRSDTAAVARTDDQIRKQFERTVAVLISDTSGLTQRTKKEGIIAALTRIRRLAELAGPVEAKYGVHLVKMEADDLFIIADDPRALFDFARMVRSDLGRWDEQHPDDDFGVAIGLGYGPTLVLPDDIWGDSVNTASKLGEDVGERGELLVTNEFFEQLDPDRAALCTPGDPARESPVPFHQCK